MKRCLRSKARVTLLAVFVSFLIGPGLIASPVVAEVPDGHIYTDDNDWSPENDETLEIKVNADVVDSYELGIDINNNDNFEESIDINDGETVTVGDNDVEISVESHDSDDGTDIIELSFDGTPEGDDEDLIGFGLVDGADNELIGDTGGYDTVAWLHVCNWDNPDSLHPTCEGDNSPFESVLDNVYEFAWTLVQYLSFVAIFAGVTLWFATGANSQYKQLGRWLTFGGLILMLLFFGVDTLSELLNYVASSD